MGNTVFERWEEQPGRPYERWMAYKFLAGLSLAVLIFCLVGIFALLRHRRELFKAKNRIIILLILSMMTLIELVHYTLSLRSKYNILFVITQEYLKTGAFLYVISFYLKQAISYIAEDEDNKYSKLIKWSLGTFYFLLFVIMVVWAVLHLTYLFGDLPCRDWTWLAYRSTTMLLVITIIIIGVVVQRTVIKKTKDTYFKEVNLTVSLDSGDSKEDHLKGRKHLDHSELGKYPLTSSLGRRKDAIHKSLKNMWIWFFMIIFVSAFDVAYVIFWRLNTKAEFWYEYTNNDKTNAILFVGARLISSFMPIIPITYALIGKQLIMVLCCCCCTRIKNRNATEYDSKDYSDFGSSTKTFEYR